MCSIASPTWPSSVGQAGERRFAIRPLGRFLYAWAVIALISASVATIPTAATIWYGPATASFQVQVAGNPYDPLENDAWVNFSAGGVTEKRLAYYDDGGWKSVLVARRPGVYSARLVVNGKPVGVPARITLKEHLKDGYIRRGGHWGFQFDSGRLYWPLGHDLGWQSPGLPDMPKFLSTMGENGINWSRIWACPWDGKNPWWPNNGAKIPLGQLWPIAIARWDAIVEAANKAGIHFNFVLFHHGEFSSTVNPNWPDCPWNVKNGGFLRDPADFFSNPHAITLAKEWVRYAVARWGHSPVIMGWELFNEVEWTDGVKNNHQAEVGAWHDEMAKYIRTIDSAKHLLTTSSHLELPIWRELDYWQPHGYPARVEAMVLGMKSPDSRPLFYGEIGPGQLAGSGPVQVQAVRDGIWSGLFALHAGAAEYWSWDLVPKYHLHREYANARKLLDASAVLGETGLERLKLNLDAPAGADLRLAPGGGWEPNRTFEFNLPEDATTAMGGFSTYFQGRGHIEMRPRPVTFKFISPKPGKVTIAVVGMSGGGGNLKVRVNDKMAGEKSWPADAQIKGTESVDVSIPFGPVLLSINNDGPDWVQIGSITVPGIAPTASAVGIGNHRMTIMRIERPSGAPTASVRISGLALANGAYTGGITDLDTGRSEPVRITVSNGQTAARISVASEDSILWVRATSRGR